MKKTELFWMGLLCTTLVASMHAADPTTGQRTNSVDAGLTQLFGVHPAKPGAFNFEPLFPDLPSRSSTDSTIPAIQNRDEGLFGVHHGRITTYEGRFNIGQAKAKLHYLSLSGTNSQGLDSRQTVKKAEQINAAQMKDYQRRFETHLAHPTSKSAPVLYPTGVQRAEDKLK